MPLIFNYRQTRQFRLAHYSYKFVILCVYGVLQSLIFKSFSDAVADATYKLAIFK